MPIVADDAVRDFLAARRDFAGEISSTVAMFNNFSTEKPIADVVLYFWESHTKNPEDAERVKATEDLIYKQFDVSDCEKYEVRTGYLSRYNHMKKLWSDISEDELNEAIAKGLEDQEDWLARCKPNLPGFIQRNWDECISEENNRYYKACKELISDKLKNNAEFYAAFLKSVDAYAEKHGTIKENGQRYILEEIAWIMSLGLQHINKKVYLIHVGNDNPAIKSMFHHFPNLAKAVKWLSPRCIDVTFANIAEFLLNYRSNYYAGCSFASHNPDLVMPISSFSRNNISRERLSSMLDREQASKDFLLSIIGKIPGHLYWLNRNNVYLGCNDLQAYDLGLKKREEVVGKTNRELFPPAEAEALDRVNEMVMDLGKAYEGEELASMQNVRGNYLTRKTPLFDTHGKIVGLLGVSIDITDRKRAEALEIKSKLQESRIEDQEAFERFISRMAHDITSPLAGLEAFMKSCSNLTAKQHSTLKNIVIRIKDISKALLLQYKNSEYKDSIRATQIIPVSLVLAEVIKQKEQEYSGDDIEIRYLMPPSSKLTFIKADRSGFDRMISNLINNSIEAIEDNKHGKIDIQLESDKSFVKLHIKDNGRGMPRELVDRIVNNIPVGTTKKTGHGVGITQIIGEVGVYGGKMEVVSKEEVGTEIILNFPRCAAPEWFTDSVTIEKGSTVLILDDDESILEVWKERLSNYGLNLKYFSNEKAISDFVSSVPKKERDKLFLFSDYDLRSDKSGLIVVMECGLRDRAVLVTGITNDKELFDLAQKLGMKVLPKQFINDLKINVT